MAGLIKKKKKDIEKVEVPAPTQFVNRSDFLTEKKEVKPKKEKQKITTIRCEKSIADELNALTLLLDYSSVNELLYYIVQEQYSELTSTQRKEFENILEVYKRKRK